MPTTSRHTSPTIRVKIGPDEYAKGMQSDSRVCTIADSLVAQNPQYTRVSIDLATTRVSDPKKGLRYIYLTPESARMILLSFDQGWPKPSFDEVVLTRAVQVLPMVSGRSHLKKAERAQRLIDLEAKEEGGTLTGAEKAALTRMRKSSVVYPDRTGPATVVSKNGGVPVVVGGTPIRQTRARNLLGGRDRHFGQKLANPGVVFKEAVDRAVEERLSTLDLGDDTAQSA